MAENRNIENEPAGDKPDVTHCNEPTVTEPALPPSIEPTVEEPAVTQWDQPAFEVPAATHGKQSTFEMPDSTYWMEPTVEEPTEAHSPNPAAQSSDRQDDDISEKRRALLSLAESYFADEIVSNEKRNALPPEQRQETVGQPRALEINQSVFELVDGRLEREKNITLTGDQRKLLKLLASELSDPESFAEVSKALQLLSRVGIEMSEKKIARLREYLLSRSQEEELQEFNTKGVELDTSTEMELKAFLIPEDHEPDLLEELDNIPAPKILDSDRRKYQAGAEVAEDQRKFKKGVGGLIGRVGEVFGAKYAHGYEEEDDDETKPKSLITILAGSLSLVVLCFCVIMIPLSNGNVNVKDNEDKFAQEQMQQIVDQHYAQEAPVTMEKNVMDNGGYLPPVARTAVSDTPDQISESVYKDNKELDHARELRWHGKTEEAIHFLESYVVQHPNVVVARIELAYCYLKFKQLRKARLACIAGLLANPSEQEKTILWQILGRCPKG